MKYTTRRNKIETSLMAACAAVALMMGACTDKATDEMPTDGRIQVTAEAALPQNGAQTRTDYEDDKTGATGMTVKWTTGDAFTVFQGNTNGQFTLSKLDNDGTGHFTGSLAATTGNTTLYALYPTPNTSLSNVSSIYLPIGTQKQAANGSMSHLAEMDFMRSTTTWDGEANTVAFENFTHLMVVLRLDITLPTAEKISNITLAGLDNDRTLDLTKDPATESDQLWVDNTSGYITLTPTDGTPDADKQYTAYLMVFPTTAMKKLEVTVKLGTGATYAKTYTSNSGITLQSGKRYWLTVKDLGSVSGGSSEEDMGGGGTTGGIGGL